MPLFALANAGIAIDGDFLARAFTSPITLGILFGYVRRQAGRRSLGASWLVTRLSRGRLRPPVGWAAVAGGGTIAGHRLHRLAADRDARVRRRRSSRRRSSACSARRSCASVADLARVPRHRAAAAAAAHPRAARHGASRSSTSRRRRSRARPHPRARATRRSRSSSTATSSAPTAARPSRSSASCSRDFGDVRYVWRHLPLNDVHPHAQLAAEAAEAAAEQGAFWEMHDLLLDHQDALEPRRPDRLRRAARPRRRALRGRPAQARRRARASPRTSTAPTSAASPARPRSSSTAAATTAPTTSTRSPRAVRAAGARAVLVSS